ncbi:HEPN domain-containing protein [Acidisphaera sp. S103]|uniref:HEPN domain-containing protein n=1 Tax=Acidisphaera sp. S103 TaxID=1747223 RepID=UPI00131C2E45|nr:HEPN domain-containing protein [Acidisphaera sp. S103]
MNSDPGRAAVSWQKAEAHLREASVQDAYASPMAVIHSSYYAMFHAARAVLFQAVGSAPKRHDGVIQQFGLLVRDLDDAVKVAGRAFNEVKDERTAADYDETIVPSPEEARDALLAATDFLAICGVRYRFRPHSP